jgi:ferredoxin-NADP reductase
MTNGLKRIRVARVEEVASEIKRFELASADGEPLPPFSAGSHIMVTMRAGDRVWRNPYSIVSATDDERGYVISVQRNPESRGGSAYMHSEVRVGSELEISDPVNLFSVAHTARKHIMVAGGIGITPMLAMLDQFRKTKTDFELHYAVRSPKTGAYYDELAADDDSRIHLYRSDFGERILLADVLSNQPLGTHLYVCGPQRMIDWALEVARDEGWPEENVHWERFSAPPPGKPFDIKLASSGKVVHVGEHQSALEALEQAGIDALYLCRGGACGQCVTSVVETDAPLKHNDHYLTDEEKAQGGKIAICVSRADGGCVTLDL